MTTCQRPTSKVSEPGGGAASLGAGHPPSNGKNFSFRLHLSRDWLLPSLHCLFSFYRDWLKIPVWWRRAVLPSLHCAVCFLSFLRDRHNVRFTTEKNSKAPHNPGSVLSKLPSSPRAMQGRRRRRERRTDRRIVEPDEHRRTPATTAVEAKLPGDCSERPHVEGHLTARETCLDRYALAPRERPVGLRTKRAAAARIRGGSGRGRSARIDSCYGAEHPRVVKLLL